jgi:mRNA-degrading endonuclease RelE of RelBE toxin-antitoxin system
VRFAARADRDLGRLDHPVRQRVISAIERLAADDPRLDVRKLTGTSEQRLRVGDWRVRFVRDSSRRQIVILRILPRGRAYDR